MEFENQCSRLEEEKTGVKKNDPCLIVLMHPAEARVQSVEMQLIQDARSMSSPRDFVATRPSPEAIMHNAENCANVVVKGGRCIRHGDFSNGRTFVVDIQRSHLC